MGRSAAGFIAQGFERWMQQFVDEPLERTLDFFPRATVDFSQLIEQPAQLIALELVGLLFESLDGWPGDPVIRVGFKAGRFFLDDALGLGPFFFACRAVPLAGLLEIVDTEEIDVAELCDGGIEVPRDGQVENEQCAFGSPLLNALELAGGDNRLASAGGADDQIRPGQAGFQPFPVVDLCAQSFGQIAGPRRAAIEDDNLPRASSRR